LDPKVSKGVLILLNIIILRSRISSYGLSLNEQGRLIYAWMIQDQL